MSIIKQHHETQKDRTRRLLFVMRYCQALNDFPKHPHIVPFEAARRFLDDAIPATQTKLWRHHDLSFEQHVLPLLHWFSYKKPFPAEWVTERLDLQADYYVENVYIPVDTQRFVMRGVRHRLKTYQDFLEEEAREAQ